MFWLTWHMWILLLLAFAGGVITGWVVRARSDTPQRARLSHSAPTHEPAAAPDGGAGAADSAASGPSSQTGPVSGDKPESDAAEKTAKADDAEPEKGSSPAPDPKSAMAMTAPMQAPGADAGPVTDGPQGETSGGPGTPNPDPADDLSQIKGLGPKAAEKLTSAGVTTVSQIANWSDADVERYDALINGRGRIVRDDWVGQAKKLAG